MPTTQTTKPAFENRIRFNWGYHDGVSAKQGGRATKERNGFGTLMSAHTDQVYAVGYRAGFTDAEAGTNAETSDAAWDAAGLPDGHSRTPNVLRGRTAKGQKIAPWMKSN